MMRIRSPFILLFFSLSFGARAQKGEVVPTGHIQSIDLVYGYKSLNSDFYGQFNTLSKSFNSSLPLQLAGISFTGTFDQSRGKPYDGHLTYCQVVPQQIIVQDSLKGNINGFVFGCTSWGFDIFPNSNRFDLQMSVGFNTGRLRITQNELLRQKNPFFSPEVSLHPRIELGKFVLSLRADFEYDISRKNWRRTYFASEDKVNLAGIKQSGLSLLAGIGYTF